MINKYLYLFLKDIPFRTVCILSVLGVFSCFILIRLNVGTGLELKDIQVKQAIIDHIPAWQAKIAKSKVVVVKYLDLTLNGIMLNNDQPMVVINNKLIKLGGKIEGKKVVLITKRSATLCDAGPSDKCIKLLLQ